MASFVDSANEYDAQRAAPEPTTTQPPGRPRIVVRPNNFVDAANAIDPPDRGMPIGKPAMSGMESLRAGAEQGGSLYFNDEIRGVANASKLPGPTEWERSMGLHGPGGLSHFIDGLTRLGWEKFQEMRGNNPGTEARDAYREGKATEQERQQVATAEHPAAHLTGEIGGAAVTGALGPEFAAGTLAAKANAASRLASAASGTNYAGTRAALLTARARTVPMMKQGAVVGGVEGVGAGEGGPDSAIQGGLGVVTGAVGGVAGVPIAAGTEAAGRALGSGARYVSDSARAMWGGAGGVANDKIARSILADRARGVGGLSDAEFAAAQAMKEPVVVADMGGPQTRGMMRSAVNTNPDAEATITKTIEQRGIGEAERRAQLVRDIAPYGGDAGKQRRILTDHAIVENNKNYPAAFNEAEKQYPGGLWHEGFQQLTAMPDVQKAMRLAWIRARNYSALDGFAPFNRGKFPFENADGYLKPTDGIKPNLPYWDAVKRELDGFGSRESRGAAEALRGMLDDLVPSYQKTRGVAAEFFDAKDALEAGGKAAQHNMEPGDFREMLRKMDNSERTMFSEGYLSRVASNVEHGEKGAEKITAKDRIRAKLMLGPTGAEQLELVVGLKAGMDATKRAAQGNSTTAKQLLQAGLAGAIPATGAGALFGQDDQDRNSILSGSAVGGGAALLATVGRFAGPHVNGVVNHKLVAEVAERLMSSDPGEVAAAIRKIAAHPVMMENWRNLVQRATATLSATAVGNKARSEIEESQRPQ